MTAAGDEERRRGATGEVTPEMGQLADEMGQPDISEGHRRALKHQMDAARKEEQRRQATTGEDQPYYTHGEDHFGGGGEDITGPQIVGNEPAGAEGDINRETKYQR